MCSAIINVPIFISVVMLPGVWPIGELLLTLWKFGKEMSASLTDILDSLTGKISMLAGRYHRVKEQRDQARSQCAELSDKCEALEQALRRADIEIERLRATHVFAPTEQDVMRARALLTELVKKTDRCISQLRKE